MKRFLAAFLAGCLLILLVPTRFADAAPRYETDLSVIAVGSTHVENEYPISYAFSLPPSPIGSPATFSFVVRNNGPEDTHGVVVRLNFFWHAGIPTFDPPTFSSSAGACDRDGVCTLGALAVGQSASVSITAVPRTIGVFLVYADTNSAFSDPDIRNNYVRVSSLVTDAPPAAPPPVPVPAPPPPPAAPSIPPTSPAPIPVPAPIPIPAPAPSPPTPNPVPSPPSSPTSPPNPSSPAGTPLGVYGALTDTSTSTPPRPQLSMIIDRTCVAPGDTITVVAVLANIGGHGDSASLALLVDAKDYPAQSKIDVGFHSFSRETTSVVSVGGRLFWTINVFKNDWPAGQIDSVVITIRLLSAGSYLVEASSKAAWGSATFVDPASGPNTIVSWLNQHVYSYTLEANYSCGSSQQTVTPQPSSPSQPPSVPSPPPQAPASPVYSAPGASSSSIAADIPIDFTFSTDLEYGYISNAVKYLQVVLNSDPDTMVAQSGLGSPGQETEGFGPLTKDAVRRFQEKYARDILAPLGISQGTGYVGRTTRAKLNEILAASRHSPTPLFTTDPQFLTIFSFEGGALSAVNGNQDGTQYGALDRNAHWQGYEDYMARHPDLRHQYAGVIEFFTGLTSEGDITTGDILLNTAFLGAEFLRFVGPGARLVLTERTAILTVGDKAVAKITGEAASTFSKGVLGERNLTKVMESVGASVDEGFQKLYHGFDGVYRQGSDIIIGEAKYIGSDEVFDIGRLGDTSAGKQMSSGWILQKARDLFDKGFKIGNEILDRLRYNSRSIRKVLIITRGSGKAGGISRAVFEMFDWIYEVDLQGNILQRFVR